MSSHWPLLHQSHPSESARTPLCHSHPVVSDLPSHGDDPSARDPPGQLLTGQRRVDSDDRDQFNDRTGQVNLSALGSSRSRIAAGWKGQTPADGVGPQLRLGNKARERYRWCPLGCCERGEGGLPTPWICWSSDISAEHAQRHAQCRARRHAVTPQCIAQLADMIGIAHSMAPQGRVLWTRLQLSRRGQGEQPGTLRTIQVSTPLSVMAKWMSP